jgi:hypothetical protein
MHSRSHATIALATIMALAACTSTREALVERGRAPAYAQGYDDGCASGKAAGGGLFSEAQKDADSYASDSQYTQGWDAGFAKCKRDQEVMTREARERKPGGDNR